jgi:trehalose 6-phosphate synthase
MSARQHRPTVAFATSRPPVRLEVNGPKISACREPSSVCNLLRREAGEVRIACDWVSPLDRDLAHRLDPDIARAAYRLSGSEVVHAAPIEADTFERGYAFATRLLWFAHHGLPASASDERDRFDEAGAAAFVALNRAVARVACARAPLRGIPLIINDYQLSLVPGLVRELGGRMPIAHMSYTAFADTESWSRLCGNWRRDVLRGMLGSDLLGFTATRWARRFVEAVVADGCGVWDSRSGGAIMHDCGHTLVRVYPVNINIDEIRAMSVSPRARHWDPVMRPSQGKRLVARTDRLDPAKNIATGFEAFGRLLDHSSHWRSRVEFVACLSPTRVEMPEYRRYGAEVMAAVQAVNARHPGAIRLYIGEDHTRALSLLRAADVTLVNSTADGMNLVAQEAVAVTEHSGALVLSRHTGSAEVLGSHAIMIEDPYDAAQTTDALDAALSLSCSERVRRTCAMRSRLREASEPLVSRLLADLAQLRIARL